MNLYKISTIRATLVIFLFLTINNNTFSQNRYDYLGTIILENNTPISFSLNLIEKDGIVNGYSLTNLGLKDETKSEVSGLYFKSNKSFQLQETQIISTKSEAAINTFCYIKMTLFLKGMLNNKRLEGTFTGNFLDSIECAKGKVILIQKEKLEKKINKVKKKINKEIKKEDIDTNHILETKILRDNNDLTINWKNKRLTLYIWDANQEDGDEIQLQINNDIILKQYETKNKKKKIKYKLRKGENIIKLTAISEGKSPPNTGRIELIDKETKYPILLQLEIGKKAIIKILK